MEEKKPTEATLAALRILREHPGATCRSFASFMWPNSEAHTKHYNSGQHGSARGTGAVRAAGGFLGKLQAAGLVRQRWKKHCRNISEYELTVAGEALLAQSEAEA